MAQATGQGAFPLTAIRKDTFEFRAAGITLEFNPIANQMTILQGGTRNVLTKSNLKLKDLVLGIFTISNSLLPFNYLGVAKSSCSYYLYATRRSSSEDFRF
jgi:hypothetical protein